MTQLDNKIERDLLRKLDRRLVAWAALAYFSNVLLRNNMRKYPTSCVYIYMWQ